MVGQDGSKPSSPRSGLGSSGSISSSFLDLKAQLERSKSSSSSTWSSKRKLDGLNPHRTRKKLSSTFLDTAPHRTSKHNHSNDSRKSTTTKRQGSHPSDNSSGSSNPTSAQLSAMRANLERKARIYEQLQAGKYAGFTSAELKEGSIDWDRKRLEPAPHSPSSPSPPPPVTQDEEQIEWVDEFGRSRTSALSDVPREFLPRKFGGDLDEYEEEEEEEEEEDNAIYGPATSFPVYEGKRKEEQKRFNPDFEHRHRGAAFYKFSAKEDERRLQLDQLKELRNETVRRESGGVNGSWVMDFA